MTCCDIIITIIIIV